MKLQAGWEHKQNDKHLEGLSRKKNGSSRRKGGETTQINKVRNQTGKVTTNTAETERIIPQATICQ